MKQVPHIPIDMPSNVAAFLARINTFEINNHKCATTATAVVKGIITLTLPWYWERLSDACKRELLCHEAAHWEFGHHQRVETMAKAELPKGITTAEEKRKWREICWKFNVVCDCAIEHNKSANQALIEAEIGRVLNTNEILTPTYERLSLPPCPPEIAYSLLPKTKIQQIGCCESLENFKTDGAPKSQDIIDLVSLEIGIASPKNQAVAGTQKGTGLQIPELSPLPKWIRKVLAILNQRNAKVFRNKSWHRLSRVHNLLPGNSMCEGLDIRVMLDASGSTFSPRLMGQFLSVLTHTQELKHSDVVVFDAEVSVPIPVAKQKEIIDVVSHKGGGTLIAKAGDARKVGHPVVWLTDGLSADGFPKPHSDLEIWVVPNGTPVPSNFLVVEMDEA